MANMSAKFDEKSHNGLVSIVFTNLFPYVIYDLDLWFLTSKIKRVHPLVIVNMSAKFDDEAHNGLVSIVSRGQIVTDSRTHWQMYGTTAAFLSVFTKTH